jgi:hypothetical protein
MDTNARFDLRTELQDWGISYEAHFHKGCEGIVARYDAPMLRYPKSTPLPTVRDTVDAWNAQLQAAFSGAGYYAFCPMSEENGEHHVLVLFANEVFYEQFVGSVEVLKLPK